MMMQRGVLMTLVFSSIISLVSAADSGTGRRGADIGRRGDGSEADKIRAAMAAEKQAVAPTVASGSRQAPDGLPSQPELVDPARPLPNLRDPVVFAAGLIGGTVAYLIVRRP